MSYSPPVYGKWTESFLYPSNSKIYVKVSYMDKGRGLQKKSSFDHGGKKLKRLPKTLNLTNKRKQDRETRLDR